MKQLQKFLQLGENTKMALETLRDHKTRSALTVLGVVIAVVVLLLVFAIMYGVDSDMRSYLEQFGTDTLFIFKFEPGIHIGRLTPEERMRKPLTLEEGEALAEDCPDVKAVTVQAEPWSFNPGPPSFVPVARYAGREVFSIDFSGATPNYAEVYSTTMEYGRFFTDAENLHRQDVAVLGYDLANTLYPAHDALGKDIQVSGMNFRVIGVLKKEKGVFLRDASADKEVIIPYLTYRKYRPQDKENFITALAYPGRKAEAEDEITGVLRRLRKVPYDGKNNFGISSAEAIATQFRQIMSSVALLTMAIASVGLMVGGVGVMNIMLMSVTERTHEIGIRKAIGARRTDVIRQFLVEAVVLTGAGGVLGVICALSLVFIANIAAPKIPAAVPLWAIGVAVAAAMSVGLFFGLYPAVKASRLDPVEALRYE